jgi:hypothetical protein
MKLQIIEIENYILAVSDEEIKENDFCYHTGRNIFLTFEKKIGWAKEFDALVKPIAYEPKGNAPEIDLPLLPEMVVEDEVLKFANEIKQDVSQYDNGRWYGRIEGYNTATKIYSEDDLKKAYTKGFSEGVIKGTCNMVYKHETFDDYLKLIKKPKTPKWFVAEIEVYNDCINHQGQYLNPNCPNCYYNHKLKTTTINGKQLLVGTYLYE